MVDNNNLEIQDTENFRGGKDIVFSHQALVMKAMNRVLEIAGHELHTGFDRVETKMDGSTKKQYIESTQAAFFEAVKTVEMVMSCDLDEEAEKELGVIETFLNETRKELLKKQGFYWESMYLADKEEAGIKIKPTSFFYSNLPYKKDYTAIRINQYRKIFATLTKLTKRLDFYAGEDFEN